MEEKTLLLLDADADCERLLSEVAAHTDFRVLLAKTSREAFKIIRKEFANLKMIVVDVDPGAHGIALLEAISACAERPPMIVVTALEEIYMEPIAAEHGAAACLGKPLRLEKMLSTIEEVSQHYGLTSDRWGSLIPPPVKKWMETKERFRGIAKKLSPTKRRDKTKSQT